MLEFEGTKTKEDTPTMKRLRRSAVAVSYACCASTEAFQSHFASHSRASLARSSSGRKTGSSSVGSSPDGDGDEEVFYDDFGGQSVGGSLFADDSASLEQLKAAAGDLLPDFDTDRVSAEPGESARPTESQILASGDLDDELLPDFDDNEERNSDEFISIPLPKPDASEDLTGCSLREFSFGPDVMLSDYAGSMGFDEVTDWQYYSVDGYSGEKTPTNPNPFDPSQPVRTREKSGSVVRLFRGELGGRLAAKMRSRGLDSRVWIKEYTGEVALRLARSEKKGLGRLQSSWLQRCLEGGNRDLLRRMEDGEWVDLAQRRYVDGLTNTLTNKDDENLLSLLEMLSSRKAQFAALLGELNLNDYWDDQNPNEWYKALGTKPPQPGSVWLVFDYQGISTAATYCVPAVIQRSKLPPKRGPFGGVVEAPRLPPFNERSRYMVQGVLRGMLSAVASAHEAGIVHRSLGRNSFILSSVGQDKREATSPYAVVIPRLRVILSDWGFSATLQEAVQEKELGVRSKLFGIPAVDSYENQRSNDDRIDVAAGQFAMAEDLNALGFVYLGLLFATLANPATLSAPMPPTDDDSWQRLFSDIFNKDMGAFRDYCTNEDVWDEVVELLDREEGAGWNLLGELLLARERLGEAFTEDEERQFGSAKDLLEHPFFKVKI